MDVEELRHQIYQFNDEELFIKNSMKPGKPGRFMLISQNRIFRR